MDALGEALTALPLDSTVSAFDPKITGIWFGSNYVVMECEARNWRPKPQMKILDEQGRTLTGEKAQTEDPGGVFTIRQRVTLQRSADRLDLFDRRLSLVDMGH